MISTLIRMSVRGGVMIVVVAFLRALLQHRVRRGVWLAAWAITVLRLLAPFSVTSPASVYNLLHPTAVQQIPVAPVTMPAAAAAASVSRGPEPLLLLWLGGALTLAMICLGLHLRSLRRYRFSLPCEARMALPPGVRVRRLEGLSAPLTYGLFRPVILLPAGLSEDSPDFAHILQHELAHIRHRDVAWKLLVLLTLAVHWFNPLVWLMAWLVSQDLEMRCDAEAVRALGDGAKKAYALTLIRAEEQKLASFLQPGFAHSGTAGRIRALAKGRSSAALSSFLAVVLSALLIVCFATDRAMAQAPAQASAPVAEEAPEVRSAPAAVPATETVPAPEPEAEPEPAAEPVSAAEPEPIPEPASEPEPAAEPVPASEPEPAAEPEPEPTPEPEPVIEVKDSEALPLAVYAPGGMTMAEGEAYSVAVATGWLELYSDNPAVLQVSGVYDAGGVFFSGFTALRAGTANVYYSLNGAWQLFAAVTVTP